MVCKQEQKRTCGQSKQHYRLNEHEGQESLKPVRQSGFRFLKIAELGHSMKLEVSWNDSTSEVSETIPLIKKTITKTKAKKQTNIRKCSYKVIKQLDGNIMSPLVAEDSFKHYSKKIIYPYFQNHFNNNDLRQNQHRNSYSCGSQTINQIQISLNPLRSSDREDQDNYYSKNLSSRFEEYLSEFHSVITLPFNDNRLIQQTQQLLQQQLKVTETMKELFTTEVKKVFEKFITQYRPPYKLKRKNSQQFNDLANINPSSSSYPSNSTNNSDFIKNNSQSNYHNMKSQLMHCLVNLFQSQILNCFNLPNLHIQQILKIISRIKENSNTISRCQTKYQHFSNLHFEALFLIISPQSIQSIKESQTQLQMYQQIFNQDLSNSTGLDSQAIYCNFYKSIIFQISLISLNIIEEMHSKDSQGDHYSKSINNPKHESRFSYLIRAKEGMAKLNQGMSISRF